MSDFPAFTKAVGAQLKKMVNNGAEVYQSAGSPTIYEDYLAAFPDGTNPIFRERAEYDCNTCKQFIRNLGTILTIKEGKLLSVWDCATDLPYPYNEVAKALSEKLKNAGIGTVYRTTETSYGTEKNIDNHDSNITWHHFYGKTPAISISKTPGADIGKANSSFQVLKRGLEEIQISDLDDVLDLIEQNSIYRGSEFKKSVEEFRKLKSKYYGTDLYVWANYSSPYANFRNTSIGTLLTDLASGDDLQVAVKKFEAKVAPSNYKRPKSLITSRMIEDAIGTLRKLDLEDAIDRRLATIEDLSVNDVLFVDNQVLGKMKDTLTDLLLSSPSVKKSGKVYKDSKKIKIEDFIALKSKSIQIIVGNEHLSNFVTLTAPVHKNVNNLFKWNNSFGWSYDGNLADSMRELVVSRGGRVDGAFRFTHQWNYGKRNASLMDLHVFMPDQQTNKHKDGCHNDYPRTSCRVGWNHRNEVFSGGVQDVDYTDAAKEGYVPVENITFPSLDRMPEGKYVCKIHNWNLRQPTQGGFKAEIEFENQIFEYEVDRPLKNKEWITVAEVTLKGGKFSIEHKLPLTSSSKEKWGVSTLSPVKVQTILLSPNHWENAGAVGNKHWFFILEGCQVNEPIRGIYNEFLTDSLHQHRKVFEVLGSKMKCQPTPNQLSGVGFSSTRSDKVQVIADGRPYEIIF